MVHSFSSPSSRFSLSSSTLPFLFSAKHPTNPNGESKQQWQQEHQCNTALRCSESKRAPVGGPQSTRTGGSLVNQQWWNMFFDDSIPRAYVKAKKTMDSSGSRLRERWRHRARPTPRQRPPRSWRRTTPPHPR